MEPSIPDDVRRSVDTTPKCKLNVEVKVKVGTQLMICAGLVNQPHTLFCVARSKDLLH